jgi:large subunit ribosomal protein L29
MKKSFHELSNEELNSKIQEDRETLRSLRFQYGVARSLENPKQIRDTKRNIARNLTVLRERQLKEGKQK